MADPEQLPTRPRRRGAARPHGRRTRLVAASVAVGLAATVVAGVTGWWFLGRPGSAVTLLGDPAPSAGATSTGLAPSGPGTSTAPSGTATGAATPSGPALGTAAATGPAGTGGTATKGGAAPGTTTHRPAATSGLRLGLAYSDRLPWTSASSRAAGLDDAVAVNAGWIRIDLPWVHIQPDSSSQWLWERYDPTVKAARARGLGVLFTVGQPPPWAQDPSCRGSYACPPTTTGPYATFVARAVAHYGSTRTAFEIWNEPNFPVFWKNPDAARYGRLLLAAAKAAHAQDPKAVVIVGGLAATAPGSTVVDQMTFLAGVCDTGACAEVDGVGYHPYTYPVKASLRPSWTTSWTRISCDPRSLRSTLRAAGHGSLKIWVTEFGAPTGGPGRESDGSPETPENPTDHVSEKVQAALAADVVATAAKDPQIAALFWYIDKDDPDKQPDREGYFGLRRADGSAKPAFAAYRDAAAKL